MQKYLASLILLLSFVAFSPTANAACLNLKTNLYLGSTGSSVAQLQDFLYPTYMKYYAPTGRGTYGKFTQGGVMRFQQTFGIAQTGSVGPQTREKIRQVSCGIISPAGTGTSVSTNSNSNSNTTGTTGYCNKPPKYCPDGVTLVIGKGPSCVYDSCPSTSIASNIGSGSSVSSTGCAPERLVCDNGSTVGRTGPNCSFAQCPTSGTNTNTTNGTKRCLDGSYVGSYESCYQTCSNGVKILDSQSCSIFGSTPTGTTGTLVCAQDTYMCSNGTYVSRSGPNCTFAQCPANTSNPTTYCTQEAFICPNGVGVFRSGPNCAFAACPTTSTTGNFKPADIGINGQTILPTTQVSITTLPAALGVEVPFTNLPNNAPLTKLYETVIDPEKNSYIFRSLGLESEQALTYRVDIPEWMEGVQFRIQTNENTLGMDAPRMITISETRGDFDTTKVRTQVGNQFYGSSCYIEGLHTNTEFYTSKNGRIAYEYEEGGSLRNNVSKTYLAPWQLEAIKKTSCIVVPGKTYYINVRFTSQVNTPAFKTTDGCKSYQQMTGSYVACGTLVQIVNDGKIDVLKSLPR